MSWFLVILFLSLTCVTLEASHDMNKLPSAVVVGTVFCDSCSLHDFSLGSHFISGASVDVECKDGNSKPRFKTEVKTNEKGEFKVELPFKVKKHVKRIKGCTFKLVKTSESYCSVASAATSSSLSLKTRKQGEHTFSAGFFSFKPTKMPNFCNQKQSIPNRYSSFHKGSKSNPSKSSERSHFSDKNINDPEDFLFPPLIPNPFQPPLIPNPFQPPPLIPNPFQPPSPPLIPNPFQPPSPPPLFPNPFQPPSPPPLFPNPFQPPSPPPLIPNPFQPPPSKPPPIFPFPPIVIPGFTPSPPPPPPKPTFPFPFPPLFPPPQSPGPPPSSSKNTFP